MKLSIIVVDLVTEIVGLVAIFEHFLDLAAFEDVVFKIEIEKKGNKCEHFRARTLGQ